MEIVIGVVAAIVGLLAGWALATARATARLGEAQVAAADVRAQLEAERRVATELKADQQRLTEQFQADQQRLTEQFKALAADALKANNEQFLLAAEERLKRSQEAGTAELARREAAVKQLVEPLTVTLKQVKDELSIAERARLEAHGALQSEVKQMRSASDLLRSETTQLVTALRSSQVRGKWGEIQLRRVVEASGMVEHVDFVEQSQVSTDDGRLRPDMIVKLAGGKSIVVDAKCTFLGYLDAVQTDDDAVRADRLKAHARHMRKHIDDLATKQYWEQFSPAPEYVVMFVPAESFLHSALETDPTLYEYAMERKVVLASPMTLVGLLRTIAYAWRQDALAENAQQVLTLGRELHGRLATMGSHLAKLGRAIETSAGAYNQAISSLERRVLVSARKFADLKVVDDDLTTPEPARLELTNLSAPELVASQSEAIVALEDVSPAERQTSGPGSGPSTSDTGDRDRITATGAD